MAEEIENGIDSIYDPSDVSRILAELRIQRIEMEEEQAEKALNRSRKIKAGTKIGSNLYKMWANQQALETSSLLKKGYELDPDGGWLKKMVTPAGGRVIPEAGGELANYLDPSAPYTRIAEGRASMRLPSGEIIGSASPPIDIRGPSTIGESIATKAGGYGSSMAAKGSGLGGGVSTALSVYDLARNWDEKSRVDRVLGGGKTALFAASMIPSPLSPFLMAGGTVLSIADMFID